MNVTSSVPHWTAVRLLGVVLVRVDDADNGAELLAASVATSSMAACTVVAAIVPAGVNEIADAAWAPDASAM